MLVDCVTLQLPKVHDPRGNLTFVEGGRQIPFDIRRVYYLYDVPGGSERGGHAHLALHQFVIAMSGSFDIVLDDGFDRKRYHLNRSYEGLYIPPMTWRELDNFSSGSVHGAGIRSLRRGRLHPELQRLHAGGSHPAPCAAPSCAAGCPWWQHEGRASGSCLSRAQEQHR